MAQPAAANANRYAPALRESKIGVWAFRKLQYLDGYYGIPPKPWSKKLEDIQISLLESLLPRCWDKDCKKRGEPCILRDYNDNGDDEVYWYCAEHSHRHGFCFGCGEFWGGSESFDFGPGYCSNCAPEFEEDYDENWVDDWSYDEA